LSSDNCQPNSSFRLALYDMPGRWRIKTTDIATRSSGEAYFTVHQPR